MKEQHEALQTAVDTGVGVGPALTDFVQAAIKEIRAALNGEAPGVVENIGAKLSLLEHGISRVRDILHAIEDAPKEVGSPDVFKGATQSTQKAPKGKAKDGPKDKAVS